MLMEPGVVGGWLKVIMLMESSEAIVVPGAIPVPVTDMPTAKSNVEMPETAPAADTVTVLAAGSPDATLPVPVKANAALPAPDASIVPPAALRVNKRFVD